MKPLINFLIIAFISFILAVDATAQFGPIGYDFNDSYVELGELKFAIRVSTENNIYAPQKSDLLVSRRHANEVTLECGRLSAAGGQLTAEGSMKMHIVLDSTGRFTINAEATHAEESSNTILILIKGIDVDSLISEYPIAKGVKAYPEKGNIRVSYPSRAATMPLVFLPAEEEEYYILSKDKQIRRKGFAVSYDHISNEPVVILSHDEDARNLSNKIKSPPWILGKGLDRIDLVRERCQDLETHFGATVHADKSKVHRDWIDGLKLNVFFHGVHWTGHMFNTFDQMAEQLEWLCNHIDGKQIMAFLPAWDGRYYNTYPEHLPDDRMGGAEGLKRLVSKAHSLNVKVVLMLGGPNMSSFDFLEKHDMEDAALKGPDGMPQIQNWLDWNIDLQIETMGLIMNFGHPQYLEYMINKTSDLFEEFDVDGVFLDGTLRWDNSPDYSTYEGLKKYTKTLRTKFPDKLLMGEDGYDAVYPLFDLFHTSGGPLGLENYLLRYTRQFYYLSYPAENGSAGVHELGWSNDSHTINSAHPEYTIPSLSLFHGDINKYNSTILQKISDAKNWQQTLDPIVD